MNHYRNDYGETWREWCDRVHAALVESCGVGLGDIFDDIDLGDYWMAGLDEGEIALDLGLMSNDDERNPEGG